VSTTIEPLIRENRTALHHQVEDRVRRLAAELDPGSPIPSERELCDVFGVSRTTVRAAIGRLVAEGVVERDQGRGTFVAKAKVQQGLVATRSFSDGVSRRGARPSSRLLERGLLAAPADVAADLEIEIGSPVIYLERLRLVDERPLVLDRAYFRSEFRALLDADVEHQSVWDLIAATYGIRAERAKETIEITSLGPEEARLLGEQVGAASFLIHLVTYDRLDRPIERVHNVCRAATRFHLELRSSDANRAAEGAGGRRASVLQAAMSGGRRSPSQADRTRALTTGVSHSRMGR
jgi:GntR family transcriptional regulator